jgi:hypothetical protein
VSRAKKIIVRDFFFLTVYMSCFFSGVVLLPAVLAYADVNILLEAIAVAPTACLECRRWGRISKWRPPIFTDKTTVVVAHALY